MTEPSVFRTSASMLARLRQPEMDQATWSEFVQRYGPRIFTWCRHWGLQEADAEDVTQSVLLKLSVHLREFEYDPGRRFRSWLKTVAQRTWIDLVRDQQREGQGVGNTEAFAALHQIPAREDLEARLEAAYDLELLAEAMVRVKERVERHTWEAFRLLTEEQLPLTEVTTRLNLPAAVVYKARSKVQKMLKEEIQALDESPS
jgi:RNA polymerase sigma-70 factor (ECF subfamily)